MGEDLDPLTTESTASLITNRGIIIGMLSVIAICVVGGFAIMGRAFGAGVLIGGVLAIINYFWLERSTRALFDQSAVSSPMLLAAKYILRYAVLGGVLWLIYAVGVVPIGAVILGLSAFAIAVVLQGLKNIFSSSFI
jgi:nitrate reductase NapE component